MLAVPYTLTSAGIATALGFTPANAANVVARDNGSGAVGSYGVFQSSAGALADGATVAGSSLAGGYWSAPATAPVFNATGTPPAGTWRNVSGAALPIGAAVGIFQRVA